MKDYFLILEIPANSNEPEIRKAYRSLAKKYHPDVNKSANAHDKFIEISEAYEFLIHQQKRFENVSTDLQADLSSQIYQEYERVKHEARAKAQKQAKMRYQEFQKQHEAFLASGMNDLVLLLTIIGRVIVLPLILVLFLTPIVLSFQNEWKLIFLALLIWPIAGIIAWNVYDKRKNYLKPGAFYYSIRKIKQLFTETKATEQKCYYCPSEPANSKPYELVLLKLKDIKLQSSGVRQHNAYYQNKEISIIVPRSKKAFIVHSINVVIRILTILVCMIFLSISSLLWKFIIGLIVGGIICKLILLLTSTKSNISYLFSFGFIIRLSVWIFSIALVSQFNYKPFDIFASDYVFFVMAVIFLGDSILMSIINFLSKKYSSRPIIRQHPEVENKFKEGYKIYNDIPVISVVFPVFKLIFG